MVGKRCNTHLGVAQGDGSAAFHQDLGNFKISTREGIVEGGHSLTQGTAGIIDVGAVIQQNSHYIWRTMQCNNARVIYSYPMTAAFKARKSGSSRLP